MFFSTVAISWFLLENGWEFFSGERSAEYIILVSLIALILIWSGYEATFGSERLLGSAIALLGAILRIWGRFALKEHFSTQVKKPSRIIQRGPYRLIRHPLYLGLILLCLGGIIASGNYWLLIPFGGSAIILIRRIIIEERFLSDFAEFKEYKEKTWRFIPFIW